MSSKKILVFVSSLTSGGAERVSVSLASYFVLEGYPVLVVTLRGSENDFFVLDGSVKRISLGLAGQSKGLGKVTANFRRLLALRKVVSQEKPDIVLGMMTGNAVQAILSCLNLPTKVVVSERNFPGHNKVKPQWSLLRRLVYPFANAHVAQTKEAAIWLRKYTRAKNITVIPNSVSWPLPKVSPVLDPEDVLDKENKLILAVGSLSHQKGFDLLLHAFASVCGAHPEWKLVILGENSGKDQGAGQREKLERLVKDKGLVGRVLMPGRAGNVGDWYEWADLFVLSSRYEGFPNVLLEAMAAGCACIAFDCDTGPRDIIRDGQDGVLVPPENVEVLAQEIDRLMGDDGLREKFGARAVEVRESFSQERIFELWKNVLE